MKGNKKSLLVVALLLLVGVTSAYVAYSYAKYTSTITGNQGTVTVAKWAFATDNTAQTFTIALDPTVDATTLVANKIAPGTTGSFNVELKNTNTEVGVDFTIDFAAVTGIPTNLKFYKNSARTTEIVLGTNSLTGQIVPGGTITVPVYWGWAYETDAVATNDPLDTADGEAARTLTVSATITGTQVAPSATGITTHVN